MTGEVANSAGVRKAATNKSRPAADGGGKQKVHSTGGVSVGLARPSPAPPRPQRFTPRLKEGGEGGEPDCLLELSNTAGEGGEPALMCLHYAK